MRTNERQWRVNLPEKLVDDFANDLEDRGMSQREGTARLIRNFLALDADVRGMMLQVLTPERTAMLARAMLEQMAKGRR